VMQLRSTMFLLQQRLRIPMHAPQLLGDGVLRAVFLLCQPLDPPDLGEELADLLRYVLAILLGHGSCSSGPGPSSLLLKSMQPTSASVRV